jgi:hypothetical protein
MRTKIYFSFMLMLFFIAAALNAQNKNGKLTDWETVDIAKTWKINAKISGGIAKSLKSEPTFIQNYEIEQATMMVGSASSSRNSSLFSGAALGGVSEDAIQGLTDELYADLVSKLKAAGLNITDGEEVVNSDYANKKSDQKSTFIGKKEGPEYEKLNSLDDYSVRERMTFWPENTNIAYNTSLTKSGLFNQNLSKNTNTNVIYVVYDVRFAQFDDDKGYKGKLYLTTKPGLYVSVAFNIMNPKGAWGSVSIGKGAIQGNNNWSKGVVEKSSKDGSFWGLSSSADYALEADEALYIAELKALITSLQSAMVDAMKEEL